MVCCHCVYQNSIIVFRTNSVIYSQVLLIMFLCLWPFLFTLRGVKVRLGLGEGSIWQLKRQMRSKGYVLIDTDLVRIEESSTATDRDYSPHDLSFPMMQRRGGYLHCFTTEPINARAFHIITVVIVVIVITVTGCF